jgi:hypothetical protein
MGNDLFYSFVDVALLMYDVTNLDSFMNLRMWKNFFASEVSFPGAASFLLTKMIQIGLANQHNFPFAVVGNKTDCKHTVCSGAVSLLQYITAFSLVRSFQKRWYRSGARASRLLWPFCWDE